MATDPYLGFTIPVPGNPGVVQQINDALAAISKSGIGAQSLNEDLVSFWPLWEYAGARRDLVSNNNLTDNATVTRARGNNGTSAAQFTAANSEFLSVADNAEVSTGDIDFAIGAWVFHDTKAAAQDIAGQWGASGNFGYLLGYDSSTDRYTFSVSNNGTAVTTATANNFGAITVSVWNHVIGWHDSVNNVIGISINNGTANTSAHTTGVFNSTAAFQIGTRAVSPQYFNGRIKNVAFWKKVLSTTERTDFYNNGVSRVFPF